MGGKTETKASSKKSMKPDTVSLEDSSPQKRHLSQPTKPALGRSFPEIVCAFLNLLSLLVLLFYLAFAGYTFALHLSLRHVKSLSRDSQCDTSFLGNFISIYQTELGLSQSLVSFLASFISATQDYLSQLTASVVFLVVFSVLYVSMLTLSALLASNKSLFKMASILGFSVTQLSLFYYKFRFQFGFVVTAFLLGTAWLHIPLVANHIQSTPDGSSFCLTNVFVPWSAEPPGAQQTRDPGYLLLFVGLTVANSMTSYVVGVFHLVCLAVGLFSEEPPKDAALKSDLDYLEHFFARVFRQNYPKMVQDKSFLFDDQRLFFEVQGSIIFVDFVRSECFFTMNFPHFSSADISYATKTKYILSMAENHIASKTIRYSRVFWIFSVLFLIFFATNLGTGLALWLVLVLSSTPSPLPLLFALLLYLPLCLQLCVILTRACSPRIMDKYKGFSRAKKFELTKQEREELGRQATGLVKLNSSELRLLMKSKTRMLGWRSASKHFGTPDSQDNASEPPKPRDNKVHPLATRESQRAPRDTEPEPGTQTTHRDEKPDGGQSDREQTRAPEPQKRPSQDEHRSEPSKGTRGDPPRAESGAQSRKSDASLDRRATSYNALEDKTLFPTEPREGSGKSHELNEVYEKYYDVESEKLSGKSHKSQLKNFDEDKILDEDFDYKLNRKNPFYRKLDLNDYLMANVKDQTYKQLI